MLGFLLVIVATPEMETGIGVGKCSCMGLVGSLALITKLFPIFTVSKPRPACFSSFYPRSTSHPFASNKLKV